MVATPAKTPAAETRKHPEVKKGRFQDILSPLLPLCLTAGNSKIIMFHSLLRVDQYEL